MIIKTKVEFSDYIKLVFQIYYRKITTIIMSFFGLLLLTIGIFDLVTNMAYTDMPFLSLGLGIFVIFLVPVFIYFFTKKSFYSHKILTQEVTYEFSDGKMKITSDGLLSEIGLNKIFKVTELKNWFLIYHNRQVANFLPKFNMTKDERMGLRFILCKVDGIKIKLRID